MAFSPGTQQLLGQYGQNTGLIPEEKKRPRYARSDPAPGPSAVMYAPNNPYGQMFPTQQPSQNAPPPQQLLPNDHVGARPANLGSTMLQHPLISGNYFDENR